MGLNMSLDLCCLDTHHKTKSHDLQNTLQGEEDSEGCVEVFEDSVIGCWCRVVLKQEGSRIQQYHCH